MYVITIDYGLPFPGMSKKTKRLWVLRSLVLIPFFHMDVQRK
jgi:hypothetical protein